MADRRRGPIAALFVGDVISLTGNRMSTLAIPWFVLVTTGSPARTGITAAAAVLPTALAGFLGGPLVDRFGFKRTSIVADIASGVSVVLIPLLQLTVGLEFWQLLVLVFTGALLDAPGTSARYSLIPQAAALARMPIERATSLKDAAMRASGLIGAPVAGVLIAVIGATNVLWVDAATFLVSAVLVGVAVPDREPTDEVREPSRYLDDLREGWRYLRGDRVILLLLLTATATNGLDSALAGVIVPVYVREAFGSAAVLGALSGVMSAGAVAGVLLYGAHGRRVARRPAFIVSFLALSARGWLFAIAPPLWVLVVGSVIFGLATGPVNPIYSAVTYERVPSRLLGRVTSLDVGLSFIAMPVGVLLAGVALNVVDVRAVLVVVSVLYTATAASLLINPAVREIERPRSDASAGDVTAGDAGR
ncbi:MAG: MFS transporter [Mycobacteriales bacterium]|nr:MFS transporter [Frankia sp.]